MLFKFTVNNTTVEKIKMLRNPSSPPIFQFKKKLKYQKRKFSKVHDFLDMQYARFYTQVWFRYSLDPNLIEFELEDQLYQMCLQVYRVDTGRSLCFRFQRKLQFGNLKDIIIQLILISSVKNIQINSCNKRKLRKLTSNSNVIILTSLKPDIADL